MKVDKSLGSRLVACLHTTAAVLANAAIEGVVVCAGATEVGLGPVSGGKVGFEQLAG